MMMIMRTMIMAMMMAMRMRTMMNLREGGEGERERAGTLSAFPESFRACNVNCIIIIVDIIIIMVAIIVTGSRRSAVESWLTSLRIVLRANLSYIELTWDDLG